MKKLTLFLLLSLGLHAQNKVGNFKISNSKIIWQKTYKKSININSQVISLRALDFL